MQSSPYSQGFALPRNPNPPDTICFQIPIPNDPAYLAAFFGVMYDLSVWNSWQRDSAHTAIVAAQRMKIVYELLVSGALVCPADRPLAIGTDGDELLIRQNPLNPCILESSINGTDWCQFADLSLCVPGGAQPGGGSPQPAPGGGCQTYHAQMPGNNRWIAPTIINSGDTIEVTHATGATNDGTVSPWRCPNGQTFFAGACVGFGGPESGDPLPTANHLQLIAQIGSVYYAMTGGPLTIPGGVVNEQVVFQVNDSALADNAGSLTFDVTVCNNSLAAWCRDVNFTTNNWGFTSILIDPGQTGDWTAGVGWVGNSIHNPGGAGVANLYIEHTLIAPRFVTTVQVKGIGPTTPACASSCVIDIIDGSTVVGAVPYTGGAFDVTIPVNASMANFRVAVGYGSGTTVLPDRGSTIFEVIINGTGAALDAGTPPIGVSC